MSQYTTEDTSRKGLPDGEGDVKLDLPLITTQLEEIETRSLSNEERVLAFADLHGRKAPGELENDRHLEAFDREMSRLPGKQKSRLHRGYTVKQARLFLDIENNDASRAAKRMARYWDERFRQLGEDAFAEENTQSRTEEDFRRVYEMALKVPLDPEVDKETRLWAKNFVDEWNRAHLLSLEAELAKIPDHEKAALVEAQKTRPNIAASDEHKLLFLRCDNFDAKRASRRLVNYWEFKFDIFGREDAFKSFTVNDLMRDHPKELSLGFYWYTRATDTFGRGLVLFVPGKALESLRPDQGCTEKGLLKVVWYMQHAMLEEQKSCPEKGIVVLSDDRYTNFSLLNKKFCSKFKALIVDCLPVKVKSLHLLAPPTQSFFQILLPFIKWSIGKALRMRLWVHAGSEEEYISKLQECGISSDIIPTTLGGNMDIDHLGRVWLAERREAGL